MSKLRILWDCHDGSPIRIKLRKEDTKMLVWHHGDTYHLLHEQKSTLMSSVSQVKQAMQTIFRQADALARQTGFVQILVTAWLNNPQATREAVAH